MPDEPRFLGGPRDPAATERIDRLRPAWALLLGPVVLEYPDSWEVVRDPGGYSWRMRDDSGAAAEVFLSLFGFTIRVPPLDEFVASQRELVTGAGGTLSDDRVLAHATGLPAHALAWSSFEPGFKRWGFSARYLRDDAAIYLLKLDQAGAAAPALVTALDDVFATVRPRARGPGT